MEKKKPLFLKISFVFTLTASLFLSHCALHYYQRLKREIRDVSQLGQLDKKSPFLKVHMLDGQVYILSEWNLKSGNESISGKGHLLNFNREQIEEGQFTILLSKVALFETNVLEASKSILAMATLTAPSALLSGYCLSNPKACFGSCPTFYAWDGEQMALQAEGFSASVCPVLEAMDIDALYRARPQTQDFELRLTNEALETHVIRYANILAVPRHTSGRTFATSSGEFWQASTIHEPKKCLAMEGSCINAVRSLDGMERFSEADSQNLAKWEILDLEFSSTPGKRVGLVIGFRQTLLTTYLFYQGLAYMGNSTGYWLAKMERGGKKVRKYSNSLGEVLGGIDVLIQNGQGDWIKPGEIKETGPLASDVRMVLLPEIESRPIKLRLRMTKGLWRIDYLALAELEKQANPIRLKPSTVFNKGIEDAKILNYLNHPESVLVTMPGDKYTLIYSLPSDFQNYELFLESKGYYLEWMRPDWLKEENLKRTIMMFTDPEEFLKRIAPEFKKIEPQMEYTFWRSKYVRK
jgi:hypothetical protein